MPKRKRPEPQLTPYYANFKEQLLCIEPNKLEQRQKDMLRVIKAQCPLEDDKLNEVLYPEKKKRMSRVGAVSDVAETDIRYQYVLKAKLLRLALLWFAQFQEELISGDLLSFARTKSSINVHWQELGLHHDHPDLLKFFTLKALADLCHSQTTDLNMQARAKSLYEAADKLQSTNRFTKQLASAQSEAPYLKMVVSSDLADIKYNRIELERRADARELDNARKADLGFRENLRALQHDDKFDPDDKHYDPDAPRLGPDPYNPFHKVPRHNVY